VGDKLTYSMSEEVFHFSRDLHNWHRASRAKVGKCVDNDGVFVEK
jgi:hypothetical protein